jgi:hypothetical protein
MNLIDLKERIAIGEKLSVDERNLILWLINALGDSSGGGPSLRFDVEAHKFVSQRRVVTIGDGVTTIATLAECGPKRVRLISAHMEAVNQCDGIGQWPPIPHVDITFDPRPYRIEGDRLVRE